MTLMNFLLAPYETIFSRNGGSIDTRTMDALDLEEMIVSYDIGENYDLL